MRRLLADTKQPKPLTICFKAFYDIQRYDLFTFVAPRPHQPPGTHNAPPKALVMALSQILSVDCGTRLKKNVAQILVAIRLAKKLLNLRLLKPHEFKLMVPSGSLTNCHQCENICCTGPTSRVLEPARYRQAYGRPIGRVHRAATPSKSPERKQKDGPTRCRGFNFLSLSPF